MDILIHTFTGLTASTIILPFLKSSRTLKIAIVATGGFGGAFPDIDAISLWSGFDGTFGRIFGLPATGRDIYYGKYWYSHHGFFHSLAGILITAFCFILISYAILLIIKKKIPDRQTLFVSLFLATTFFLGGVFHIFEDMLTPAGAWGGVRLIWKCR